VNEEALTKAPVGVAVNLAALEPMEANDEAQSLHQISQRQVVDENDVLIQADIGTVVLAGGNQTVADEAEEGNCGDDGK